jgi:hypothetical protein
MAGKPKKGTPQSSVSALARERAPMVSLKSKKPKKTSRGK